MQDQQPVYAEAALNLFNGAVCELIEEFGFLDTSSVTVALKLMLRATLASMGETGMPCVRAVAEDIGANLEADVRKFIENDPDHLPQHMIAH